jgi:O-antigen ligase
MSRLLLFSTCLFLFAVPFPGSAGTRAVTLTLAAAALAAIHFRDRGFEPAALPRAVLVLFASWALLAFASIGWSVQPALTLSELKSELLYGSMALAIFFLAARELPRWSTWKHALLAGSLVVLAMNFAREMAPLGISRHAVDGQGGMWSTHLVLIAPFVLAIGWNTSWSGVKAASVRVAAFVLLFAAAWQTGNRMVWIALGVQLLVALACSQWALAPQGARPRGLRAPIAVALLVIVPAFVLATVDRIALATPEASVAAGLANDVRPRIWAAAWSQFLEAPWVGHGFGREILAEAFIPVTPKVEGHPLVMHSHNMFIDMALQLGAVGLALFVALLGALAWEYRRYLRDPRLAPFGVLGLTLLAGFVVKNLTDDFLHRHNGVLFWALNGMLVGLARWPRERAAPAFTLSREQLAAWQAGGFLVLRGLMSPAELARVRAAVDEEWRRSPGNDHEVDVLSGPNAGRTFRMAEVPDGSRNEVYKLNNLFARRGDIRQVALSPRLRAACAQLLEGEPMICNSLNFERGSQQPFHIDTWYMPPPVEGRMVVASIALDDVDADNGPVAYYPGSHLIPPYRFSTGRLNEVPAEMPLCTAYLEREIAARGLQAVEFHCRAGDVFIWHAQLLHGGRPIRDMKKTRSSLVVHYWRAGDFPPEQVRVDPAAGSYLGRTLRGEIGF